MVYLFIRLVDNSGGEIKEVASETYWSVLWFCLNTKENMLNKQLQEPIVACVADLTIVL